MNPASPEDSGLIYNYNAEDGVGDKENNVKEELVCDIKIEEVEFIEQQRQKSPPSNAWISDQFLTPESQCMGNEEMWITDIICKRLKMQ